MTYEWGKIIGHMMMYGTNILNRRNKLKKDVDKPEQMF